MSDISIDAREDDETDIAVRNLELDFVNISIGDVEIELTWAQGMALYWGLNDLFGDGTAEAETDARNTSGPTGTFGCACVADDADMCAKLRHVNDDGYRCQCQCHVWREQDAADAAGGLL